MNWILNRMAGPWLSCPNLELSIWGLPGISDAPSHAEHGLTPCEIVSEMEIRLEGISVMVSSRLAEITIIFR
jgi:hypothetical protein